MTRSPRGRSVRLGSIWERAAQETGELYFAGYIDTARSGYVALRIFRSSQNPDVWNMVRNTSRRRQSTSDIALPDADHDDGHTPMASAERPKRQRAARQVPDEDRIAA